MSTLAVVTAKMCTFRGGHRPPGVTLGVVSLGGLGFEACQMPMGFSS
jgi:hypothetical protein